MHRLRLGLLWLVMLPLGCGFQLRGAVQLPEDVSRYQIQGGGALLVDALRARLREGGAEIVAEDEAQLRIQIQAYDHRRENLTRNPSGRVQEYQLLFDVSYVVLDLRQQPHWRSEQTLSVRRTLAEDDQAVLSVAREQETLQGEMEREAAGRMLSRISASLRRRP